MDIRDLLKLTVKNQKEVTIGIIGMSGRDDDKILTKRLYNKMVEKTKDIISDYNVIKLISGGSSWCDHIAIDVGKDENIPTTLFLPCNYDIIKQEYSDDTYFGKRLNYLHYKFAKVIKKPTLKEIGSCNLIFCKNFYERNTMIAKNADVLIAFGKEKLTKGTKTTFDLCKGKKIHVNVSNM